jgi:uncharacterized SAM-binding protein YcdF (DUF218 family)
VTELVAFLFSAGGIVCFLTAAALWIAVRPRSTAARRFLLAVALIYLGLSSYVVSHATGRLLVGDFRPFDGLGAADQRVAIVVLGSGSFTARDWDRNRFSIPDRAAASRVLEAFRVFRSTRADWVISSGGLVDPDDPHEMTALTMAEALIRLGIPSHRVLIEDRSRNTHEEAVMVKALLAGLAVDQVVLVTSDLHMRRALGTFRAEGVEAMPAIARPAEPALPAIGRMIPTEVGLAEAAAVWHEIIGLGYYVARGWYRS